MAKAGMTEIDLGPTGKQVAANVARLRERMNLSYAEFAKRLDSHGRGIPTLGLRRIEARARRVDVDDLMAIASVLNVSPLKLLLPPSADDPMPTGLPNGLTHDEVWAWARGETNLDPRARDAYWAGQAVKARDEIRQLESQLQSEHAGMRKFAEWETAALNAKLDKAHARMNELARNINGVRDSE